MNCKPVSGHSTSELLDFLYSYSSVEGLFLMAVAQAVDSLGVPFYFYSDLGTRRIVCVNDAMKSFDFMADKATDPLPNPVLHSDVRGRRMRCN